MGKRFLLPALLLPVLLAACSAASPAAVPMTPLQSAQTVSEESAAEPFLYENTELGFTFEVPARWDWDNYKIVVSHGEQAEDGTEYSQVAFCFQSDSESPLLTIYRVSSSWWRQSGGKGASFLGERGEETFCYALPMAAVYNGEEKTALYASMMLTPAEVESGFTLMDENDVSYVEGVVTEAAMHSLVLETGSGQTLSFVFDESCASGLTDGLLLGDTLRIGYRGELDGADTRHVTVVSMETLSRRAKDSSGALRTGGEEEPVPIEAEEAS